MKHAVQDDSAVDERQLIFWPQKSSGWRPPRSAPGDGPARGILLRRHFTRAGIHPFDAVEWEERSASINAADGTTVFTQEKVEVPASWSATATNVVASKYFKGSPDLGSREHSVKQLISRVVDTITAWGIKDGYFSGDDQARVYSEELSHILLHQIASFNSPVWFNVGIEERPQCSACFINSVEDTMDSILDLAKTEGTLFKHGSGTGTNLSTIRSSKERLSSGGHASGPVSFMRGYDAFAGVIKSGGKTRRAAKMVILDVDHPDVAEFVQCKIREERKAKALIAAGYDGSLTGEAYSSVFFQNSNNSVRVTDDFMERALRGGEWNLRAVTNGEVLERRSARELLRLMAECAHECGDPGLQFDTTANAWHTCADTTRIRASNPCSEYMFVDDSACNLASLNLVKFVGEDGAFDVESFRYVVDIMIAAQDIIVDNAQYPTLRIGANSHRYRPLGLGYANLGCLLMSLGLPYDSDQGRALAAAITALMTGEAYRFSTELASLLGPFEEYSANRSSVQKVLNMHREKVNEIDSESVPSLLLDTVRKVWQLADEGARRFGVRNAQVSVLAPTGTISFMMDCDTTGIEPDIALVKTKKMVDGGTIRMVNRSLARALTTLGYAPHETGKILDHVERTGTIEGAGGLHDDHLPVFDCALTPERGVRCIGPLGHLRMMAAVQPFISGAISKTVNVGHETTVDEIYDIFVEAWKLGLKAVCIYRDGCKNDQPLSVRKDPKPAPKKPMRRRLPAERLAVTHKFSIGGHEGYITVGKYEDGSPGEIFVRMAKEGSVVSGLMDSFATATSIMLQYGVPLTVLIDKFSHLRFEPSGATTNPQIPTAKSVLDYIFRWLALKFFAPEEADTMTGQPQLELAVLPVSQAEAAQAAKNQIGSPPCPSCGSITISSGKCYVCPNCGTTTGCS
ncbi:vitamin B12-dependent ribonucleotide reductase [Candidatus Fermentibacteria bacterium]|nr:vitamin B12-dependent ribonucleotide reductase [Candidatus Fermentibacteria bacterium]